MGARFRSWWQIIVTILVVIIILIVVIVLITVEIKAFGTGFKGKTLWDWLQLLSVLAVPVVVGFGAVWFTARQNHDFQLARAQHENGLKIAADNQQEVALQGYIDKMSELLLDKQLRQSQPDTEVRNIARVRTLTVLLQLNPERKTSVMRFLQESGLIYNDNTIVKLNDAQLIDARLVYAKFEKVNLSQSHLRRANLYGADLSEANLTKAVLIEANLTEADLTEAILFDANLSRANLKQAKVTDEQLKQARSLQGATMPDGSIHP